MPRPLWRWCEQRDAEATTNITEHGTSSRKDGRTCTKHATTNGALANVGYQKPRLGTLVIYRIIHTEIDVETYATCACTLLRKIRAYNNRACDSLCVIRTQSIQLETIPDGHKFRKCGTVTHHPLRPLGCVFFLSLTPSSIFLGVSHHYGWRYYSRSVHIYLPCSNPEIIPSANRYCIIYKTEEIPTINVLKE